MAQLSGNSQASGLQQNPKPSADVVDDFHTNSDADARAESLHHTLGPLPTQAAAGNHRHDGGDSALILEGITVSGSRATDAWRLSVMAALVRLGVTDSTTP